MTLDELMRDLVERVADDPRQFEALLTGERLAVAVALSHIDWLQNVVRYSGRLPVAGLGTRGGARREPLTQDSEWEPMEDHDRGAAANAAAFNAETDDVFGRIAGRYDVLCDIFSFGLHRLWKQRVAEIISSHDWQSMLDAASGTGHIVSRVLRLAPEVAESRHIIVSDISAPMLAISQRKTAPLTRRLDYRILDAHDMPSIASGSIDLYSISLGLKICDRAQVMKEAYRVLRPGGRFVALEASAIVVPVLHRLYLVYMNICMPLIGRIATGGDASAYLYLLKGVHDFPDAEQLARELREVGFEGVHYERLSLGIVAIHSAQKPTAG